MGVDEAGEKRASLAVEDLGSLETKDARRIRIKWYLTLALLSTKAIGRLSGIDTQGRLKEKLGVLGVPHVIIVEPDGYVIWEGFPLQPGYELTEEIIEKILDVGRKLRAEAGSGK